MFVKSKSFKKDKRLRSKIRIRRRITGSDEKPRISVYKSSLHTYAQAISDLTGKTVAAASTKEKEVLDQIASIKSEGDEKKAKSSKSVAAAMAVGLVLGKRIKEQNISKAVFDRNGFVFHGRVKAVADGARKAGIAV